MTGPILRAVENGPVLDMQTARSRSNCDCGGSCFYCGRTLAKHWHEHDHFPIPARHGGVQTVPVCHECHSQKDRRRPIGTKPAGGVDEPVFASIMEGMAELPVALEAGTGDQVPLIVYALYDRTCDWREAPRCDWNGADWLPDEIALYASTTASAVGKATTIEARIFIAHLFCVFLDTVNDNLIARSTRDLPRLQPLQ